MLLLCLFGDLLRLGKFRNSTAGINSNITLPALVEWLGVCWYTMENNISSHSFAKMDKHKGRIISLQVKVSENHKEMIENQKKLKPIIEGMENNKRLKCFD